MKVKADWIDKKISRIINLARYNSQWTNVVDKEIADKSFELGINYAISEIAFLIELYERENVSCKEHEKMKPEFYELKMNLINKFIEQLKKTNQRLRTITE
jgi:hypothetical protein